MHLLPAYASCEGGRRDGPVCLLQKIVKIVMSIKTRDLVPLLTNAEFPPPTSKLVALLTIKKQGGALEL
jgi:hypothetical protein